MIPELQREVERLADEVLEGRLVPDFGPYVVGDRRERP